MPNKREKEQNMKEQAKPKMQNTIYYVFVDMTGLSNFIDSSSV